ncbi:MAG: SDR family NAD(P)-dependent oxidoreductase, partial [Sphaerochaetaceae bacterium]
MRKDPFDLTGKNAVVTGASQGLGWGMAKGLAEAGAFVILVDINPKVIKKADELRNEGLHADAYITDLLDRSKRTELKKAIEKQLNGRLNIIINNAGIQIRHAALEFP